MAAKNVSDWITENYDSIRTGLRYQKCWDAATKAAEEIFKSTNTGSPKLFLLSLRDVLELEDCSESDKLESIKLMVDEQLQLEA